MILYEVNISLPFAIRGEYQAWLKGHVAAVLSSEGFIDAKVFEGASQDPSRLSLSVHYTVRTQKDLDHYLKTRAPQLRQDGIERFGDKVQITRRILKLKD